jgi:hypothetical protein
LDSRHAQRASSLRFDRNAAGKAKARGAKRDDSAELYGLHLAQLSMRFAVTASGVTAAASSRRAAQEEL